MVKFSGSFSKFNDLISYFVVACIGVTIQLIVSSSTQNYLGLTFENSVMTGYIVAFIFGFFLTKVFAFGKKKSDNSVREAIKFLFVSIFSGIITVKGAYYGKYLLNEVFMLEKNYTILKKNIDVVGLVSHFFGMGLSFIVNFVSHKNFTFKSTGIYTTLTLFFKK